jgi:site-specific recombinase XerD
MPRRVTTRPVTAAQVPGELGRAGALNGLGAADLTDQVRAVLQHWRDAPEHSEQTRARMSETAERFRRRAAAAGVTALGAVTPSQARGFVLAPTGSGRRPELATQHARRTSVRTLFRTARLLGIASSDPTLDLRLPPRGTLAARPLTDDEVTLCRASAQMPRGGTASVRTAAWALGEAGAVTSEITAVRARDLDDHRSPRTVRLPGTRRHDPRTVPLTPWASGVLQRRVALLLSAGATGDVVLAYGGQAPPGGAKAQASVCNALREVLDAAGLTQEADVRPASLRNWVGRTAYDNGAPIEHVARVLGLRTLDAAAEDIALTWRDDPVDRGAQKAFVLPQNPRTAGHSYGRPPTRSVAPTSHLSAVPDTEENQ